MKDSEIKKRLYTKIDLLGLGNDQANFARWVANSLTLVIAQIIKDAAKKK
jgi:hypothetical protein